MAYQNGFSGKKKKSSELLKGFWLSVPNCFPEKFY